MNRTITLGLLAAMAGIVVGGCASHITQEQLTEMRSLRDQETTLKAQIAARETEKSSVNAEIAARQNDLNKCNSDQQFVNGKLPSWPNVWPDAVMQIDTAKSTTRRPRR